MRVVQLGPWPPPHGGVQTNLVSIRRYLRERGHYCAAINLTRFRGDEKDDVYFPATGAEVLQRLWQLRPEVVHLHIGGTFKPRLLALCLACSAIPGSKSVLTFHSGGYPGSPEGLSARPWTVRGMIFRQLDAIIAVNAEIENLFHRFGVPAERVKVICPHAPPARSDAPYPDELARFIAAHRPFLFSVGGLEPEYDLPLQIATLGKVLETYPEAGLVIAGGGSQEAEVRTLIAAQPWAKHVLLWGDMPHAVTLRAIAECDALLRTTHYDGDSIAVREGLSLGTPVIATDNGMRPQGVRLFPARDGAALAAAIAASVAQGRQARAPAESDESSLAQVLELYEELKGRGSLDLSPGKVVP